MSKLSNNLLDRTIQVQSLHSDVVQDIQAMKTMVEALPNIKKRMDELHAYYQTQWLEDVETIEQDSATLAEHQAFVPEGEYSILGEDTLWHDLEAYHEESRALLRAIVELI